MWEIPDKVRQKKNYLKDKHGTIVCDNSVVYSPQLEHAMPLKPTVAVLVGVGGGAPKDKKIDEKNSGAGESRRSAE